MSNVIGITKEIEDRLTAGDDEVNNPNVWTIKVSDVSQEKLSSVSMIYGKIKGAGELIYVDEQPYLSLVVSVPQVHYVKKQKKTTTKSTGKVSDVRIDVPVGVAKKGDTAIIGGKFAWLATLKPDTKLLLYGTLRFNPFRVVCHAVRRANDIRYDIQSRIQVPISQVIDDSKDGVVKLKCLDTGDIFKAYLPKETFMSLSVCIEGIIGSDYDGRFRSPYRFMRLSIANPVYEA